MFFCLSSFTECTCNVVFSDDDATTVCGGGAYVSQQDYTYDSTSNALALTTDSNGICQDPGSDGESLGQTTYTLAEDGSLEFETTDGFMTTFWKTSESVDALPELEPATYEPTTVPFSTYSPTVIPTLKPTPAPVEVPQPTRPPRPPTPPGSPIFLVLECPPTSEYKYYQVTDDVTFDYAMVPSNPPEANNGILCGIHRVSPEDIVQWIGFGISADGGMVGSDAILYNPTSQPEYDGLVGKYDLNGKSPSTVVPMNETSQTLRDTYYTSGPIEIDDYPVGWVIEMSFTKLLVEEGEIPIKEVGENIFLYAYGEVAEDGTLLRHSERGAFTIDFSAPPATKDPTSFPMLYPSYTDMPTKPTPAPTPTPPPTPSTPTVGCPATEANCMPGGCEGVCKGSIGSIGVNSCLGTSITDATCVNLNGTVADNACRGVEACTELIGK